METITDRKYKQIDIEKFKNDIEQSYLYTMTESTCNEDTCDMETMAAQYNTTLWKIMDDHAPEKTKTEKETGYALVQRWNERSQTWQTEGRTTVVAAQRWPHKNVTCREEYRLVRNRCRSAIDEAKTEYYSGKVQECAGYKKKLFEIIKSPTKQLQQKHYPDSDSLKDLSDAFGDFFYNED